jgi:defect-in-organelle-trafficking protein DotD
MRWTLSVFSRVGPFALMLGLGACAATPIPTYVDVPGMANPEIALRESFASVDAETGKLGRLDLKDPLPPAPAAKPASAPAPATSHLRRTAAVPGELQRVVAFQFNGSLDDGVTQLAKIIGYDVAIQAPPNAEPKPIVVEAVEAPVVDYLRSIGNAVGDRATVEIDPQHHQIQVIHHV